MEYDSAQDTLDHIRRVAELLNKISKLLIIRGIEHDKSKLYPPEKEIFDTYTPKLKDTTYGSEEYKTFLEEMQVALEHHYSENPHHPEHYKNGIDGMDLLDVIEMLCDWKAASERHDDGDINKSILFNERRFGISKQLINIFQNTIKILESKEV